MWSIRPYLRTFLQASWWGTKHRTEWLLADPTRKPHLGESPTPFGLHPQTMPPSLLGSHLSQALRASRACCTAERPRGARGGSQAEWDTPAASGARFCQAAGLGETRRLCEVQRVGTLGGVWHRRHPLLSLPSDPQFKSNLLFLRQN